MRVRDCALGITLCCCSLAAPAAAQVTRRTAARELGDMFADVGYLWSSPARAGARDWVGAVAVGAGAGALLPVDDQVDAWIVRHPRSAVVAAVRPFRESNEVLYRLPTVAGLVPISVVLVTAGLAADKPKLREAGYGCLSGWMMSNTLRYAIYAGVSRPRPAVANGDQYAFSVPGGSWDEQSFFAGHAMNAFACATFLSERFELGAAEPLLYTVATTAALARMADRGHWASDTFLGGVVGYAVGRTIARRYERRGR